MRVFVTGGTGFIGQHVVNRLCQKGHQVMVLTRRNRSQICFSAPCDFVQGDLGKNLAVETMLKEYRPDVLIHLAWEGLPDYRSKVSTQNIKYGLDLYEAAAKAKVPCIISSGSCWEYSNRKGCLTEDHSIDMIFPFAIAKNTLHLMGKAMSLENDSKFYWLRLFYVYGPGQRSTSLIPYMIDEIKNGRLPVLREPENRHDFIHVNDVARALQSIMTMQPQHTTFNVGSGRAITVASIARQICHYMNVPEIQLNNSSSQNEVDHFWADITQLNNSISWQPEIDVRQGIANMIDQPKERL